MWGRRCLRASLSLLPWSSMIGRGSLHMRGRCPGIGQVPCVGRRCFLADLSHAYRLVLIRTGKLRSMTNSVSLALMWVPRMAESKTR